MHKRIYEDLAQALGSAHDLDEAVAKISAVCLDDNPNFQPDRFRQRVAEVMADQFDIDQAAS